MWVITLFFATSLFITSFSHLLIVKKKPTILLNVVRRMPWALVPFVLGMTTLVIALNKYQVTDMINNFLSQFNNVASYGITSFLFSNLINNIPMSILYTSVLGIAIPSRMAVYATIIGSNLGAIFTPVGALAGIMWMSILKDQRIKYSYLDFFRYGLIIGIPLLVISLVSLSLVL
jgi:arsenical pump membrane protein